MTDKKQTIEQTAEVKQTRTEKRDADMQTICKELTDKGITIALDAKHHANRITLKQNNITVLEIFVGKDSYNLAIKKQYADKAEVAYDFKESWALKASVKNLNNEQMREIVVRVLTGAEKAEAEKAEAKAKKEAEAKARRAAEKAEAEAKKKAKKEAEAKAKAEADKKAKKQKQTNGKKK